MMKPNRTGWWLLAYSLLGATDTRADYSEPYAPLEPALLERVEHFISKGWQAIALARGDLNGDEQEDYALVIQKNDPANIQSSGGLIAADINTNPRHLLILLTRDADDIEADGEQLIRKRLYRRFIPVPDPEHPDQVEPLSYIGIENGRLEIKFEAWETVGSWQRSDLTYRFRYRENGHFVLTHFEHFQVNRASGMFKTTHIDLPKGELIKTSGSMSSPRHRKDSLSFPRDRQWTLCDIKQPLNFRPDSPVQ
ncbi:MAG: hypothetical protein R3E95_15340 [Thiolinea sp.]